MSFDGVEELVCCTWLQLWNFCNIVLQIMKMKSLPSFMWNLALQHAVPILAIPEKWHWNISRTLKLVGTYEKLVVKGRVLQVVLHRQLSPNCVACCLAFCIGSCGTCPGGNRRGLNLMSSKMKWDDSVTSQTRDEMSNACTATLREFADSLAWWKCWWYGWIEQKQLWCIDPCVDWCTHRLRFRNEANKQTREHNTR